MASLAAKRPRSLVRNSAYTTTNTTIPAIAPTEPSTEPNNDCILMRPMVAARMLCQSGSWLMPKKPVVEVSMCSKLA